MSFNKKVENSLLIKLPLEELWQLFPIILKEPNPEWDKSYAEMETIINEALKGFHICRISHIGSTAITGIWAKPIVDILVEIAPDESIQNVAESIQSIGFICMSESDCRMSFNKGYTINGFEEKVYHLHLRFFGDNDELYFRDYMNEYPNLAKEYEDLKLLLWEINEFDRDSYTSAKSSFVKKYTAEAKMHYGAKYSKLN